MIIKIKQGNIINVLSGKIEIADIIIKDDIIIGVGDYAEDYADEIIDAQGRYICPSFIDSHIHIESSMLLPSEFARIAVKHGTGCIVADPHEIANVCGTDGIDFMLHNSENPYVSIYYMMPSCVPASPLEESGATLKAEDIKPYYSNDKVLGLGEVMNYTGVLNGDKDLMIKINDAKDCGKIVNGHAPLLSGKDLERYIAVGITDDHECSTFEEAKERIEKGQWVMIRQGTAAKNMQALMPLFDEPYSKYCMLATDDKHPEDLIKNGHIDDIIRFAVKNGKSAIAAIQMATVQTAKYYKLNNIGVISKGYKANLLVLEDLIDFNVLSVFKDGLNVYNNPNNKAIISNSKGVKTGDILSKNHSKTSNIDGKISENNSINYSVNNKDIENFRICSENYDNKSNEKAIKLSENCIKKVYNSFNLDELKESDFIINEEGLKSTRIIEIVQGQLITNEQIKQLNYDINNGINVPKDIVKIAVIERHKNSKHIGLGFISGTGLKQGACASSIAHDSHNLIIVGTNEKDMMVASNAIREIKGGIVTVKDGKIVESLALPVAGIMSDRRAEEVAIDNEKVHKSLHLLGVPDNIELLMTMSFISLPVIPHLKLTVNGLVNVDKQELIPLILKED